MQRFVKHIKLPQYNSRPSGQAMIKAGLLIVAITYLVYHLLQGNRGMLAMLEIRQSIAQERAALTLLQKQSAGLQHRVQLLRPRSLGIDTLDECARAALNVAAADEIVIDVREIRAAS